MSAIPQAATGATVRQRRGIRIHWSPWVLLCQAIVVAAFLSFWQWGPQVGFLHRIFPFLDPFFISSPSKVGPELWNLASGAHNTATIWPYLKQTLWAAIFGTAVGAALGALGGLLLSNNDFANRVFQPFIHALNAIPRVALIPVIIIIVGPTSTSSAVTALVIVVFIVFYNAFEGGRSIAPEIIQNAGIFGAGPISMMLHVRLPYVLAWTFATLPNAISFGLVGAVTAELLTGAVGIGRLLTFAVSTADATLTFALVIYLAVVGVLLVWMTSLLRRRLLRWWDQGRVSG